MSTNESVDIKDDDEFEHSEEREERVQDEDDVPLRLAMNRKRLAEAWFHFSIASVLNCPLLQIVVSEYPDLGNINESLAWLNPIFHQYLQTWSAHHNCSFPGCKDCVVLDGNAKLAHSICSEKRGTLVSGYCVSYTPGCTETPISKSRYCMKHSIGRFGLDSDTDSGTSDSESDLITVSTPVATTVANISRMTLRSHSPVVNAAAKNAQPGSFTPKHKSVSNRSQTSRVDLRDQDLQMLNGIPVSMQGKKNVYKMRCVKFLRNENKYYACVDWDGSDQTTTEPMTAICDLALRKKLKESDGQWIDLVNSRYL
ncbi:hypothetical protein BCR33DRAFT_739314 [Rhizoclosmatium globosum]|uniref:Uncharacterized protein n=1 Tax=Rhizoclosmatium globosum TaxID=329046 RepID=A0A1Y2C600_9FUNG|nr:hypothetical protein BCR33DRAFT_739314 [Rhizoclosmatium globosum]|eukprot:ORY42307.1 hypothetical protein BCR33DRAFT_739314 [Rhizoclosmatium globosum]